MLVSLIPFFLVARLPVDDVAWKYGPEFVFDVEANVTGIPVDPTNGQRYTKSASSNLFCRPKEADKLSCHLGNLRKPVIDNSIDNLNMTEHEMTLSFTDKEFVIKFNGRGVELLVVEEDLFTARLNFVRTVVELLNIGVDLNGKPDGVFIAPENSTIGQCNVTFDVNHFPSKSVLRKLKSLDFELESLPQLNKVSGEAIVIQKTRNLNNCSDYADFYYGTYGEKNVVETSLDSRLESSNNRIFVSDTQFVSSVIRSGFFDSRNKHDHLAFTEQMSLSLKEIRPAKKEIPTIPKASITTIVANGVVCRIPLRK